MKVIYWQLIAALALVLAGQAVFAPAGAGHRPGPVSGAISLRFEPVSLSRKTAMESDVSSPEPIRIGKLVYWGGLRLSTPNHWLGGLSGLIVSPDGRSLTALSDRGWWFKADLTYAPDGRLSGAGHGRLIKMLDLRGRPLIKRDWADAEGLTTGPAGKLIVSFERRHRIWVYDRAELNRPVAEIPLPDWLRPAPGNTGLEAITRLANGDLLVIDEEFGQGGLTLGGLRQGKTWSPFQFRLNDWFKPTAAACLPNGDVLVLERRFSVTNGFEARLVRLAAGQIKPGRVLKPTLVAAFQKPLRVDNLEGLSVRRDASDRIFIYLISDNNYLPWQRTLLLMFQLID